MESPRPLQSGPVNVVSHSHASQNSRIQTGTFNYYGGEGYEESSERVKYECIRALRWTDPHHDLQHYDQKRQFDAEIWEQPQRWILTDPRFQEWLRDDDDVNLIHITGGPGTGKTMLMCTIVKHLERTLAGSTLSFCFCNTTSAPMVNTGTHVLRNLIFCLIRQHSNLLKYVNKEYQMAGNDIFEGARSWSPLSRILFDMLDDNSISRPYLLIDALDEVEEVDMGGHRLSDLVRLLAQARSKFPRVKWLMCSRPSDDIKIRLSAKTAHINLEASSELGINAYIAKEVHILADMEPDLYSPDIQTKVASYLQQNAGSAFLWVALVCSNLKRQKFLRDVSEGLKEFPPGLHPFYSRMLDQIVQEQGSSKRAYILCTRILALLLAIQTDVTALDLSSMASFFPGCGDDDEITQQEAQRAINLCGSFLSTKGDFVEFRHQSAKEFLVSSDGGNRHILPDGLAIIHSNLFSWSMKTMLRNLKRDIYALEDPGYEIRYKPQDDINDISIVQPGRTSPDPLEALRYPCLYWVNHLQQGRLQGVIHTEIQSEDAPLDEAEQVDMFLKTSFLYWVEALSLLKSVHKGIQVLIDLEAMFKTRSPLPQLLHLVLDCKKFLVDHQWEIQKYPLQTYASTLIFNPTESLVSTQYKSQNPAWVRLSTNAAQGGRDTSCVRTVLVEHPLSVTVLAFSPNGKYMAALEKSGLIHLWTMDIGREQVFGTRRDKYKVFDGMTPPKLVFADDDRIFATTSIGDLEIWCVSTAQILQSLQANSAGLWSDSGMGSTIISKFDIGEPVHNAGDMFIRFPSLGYETATVEYSLNGQLAIAFINHSIHIWNLLGGTHNHIVIPNAHRDEARWLVFSAGGEHILSASTGDHMVKMWNTHDGQLVRTFATNDDHCITALTTLRNGKYFAAAYRDNRILVWNVKNGTHDKPLLGDSTFEHLDLSSTARFLLSLSTKEFQIWDLNSGHCVQADSTFTSRNIRAVSILPDEEHFAVVVAPQGIEVHQIQLTGTSTQLHPRPQYYTRNITCVALSNDEKHVASGLDDNTIGLWDTETGNCRFLEGHIDSVKDVSFSNTDNYIVSTSASGIAMLWKAPHYSCIWAIQGVEMAHLAFSHNDRKLVTLDNLCRGFEVWDIESQERLKHLTSDGIDDSLHPLTSITCSQKQDLVAVSRYHSGTEVWDMSLGTCLKRIEGVRNIKRRGDIINIILADELLVRIRFYDIQILNWSTGIVLVDIEDTRLAAIDPIYFDEQTCDLKTTRGTMGFKALTEFSGLEVAKESKKIQLHGYNILPSIGYPFSGVGCEWIKEDGRHLIWIPPAYRRKSMIGSSVAVLVHSWTSSIVVLKIGEDGKSIHGRTI